MSAQLCGQSICGSWTTSNFIRIYKYIISRPLIHFQFSPRYRHLRIVNICPTFLCIFNNESLAIEYAVKYAFCSVTKCDATAVICHEPFTICSRQCVEFQ